MPFVSIITPCYNSAKFVDRTIDSVQHQTFADWEHIVVDDGSTDESAAIVEELSKSNPRIRLVRQSNGGVASARNNGLKIASPDSKYLLFLDADDCLEPHMLETMVAHLEANYQVGLAYCDPLLIDAEGNVLPGTRGDHGWAGRVSPSALSVKEMPEQMEDTPFVSLFAGTTIIPSIALLRRSVFELTPGFDETFGHVFEDFDLFLQMGLRAKVHHVAQPLVRYRLHPNQSTSNAERLYRQEQKLYAKWRSIQGLTDAQRKMVDQAIWFREGRVVPYRGMLAGTRSIREGKVIDAIRFYGGALRRYIGSWFCRVA